MSVDVLVIGLALAVPVLFAGLLGRGRWKVLYTAAVVIGIGAVLTGAEAFVSVDLLAILVAWLLVRHRWRTQSL